MPQHPFAVVIFLLSTALPALAAQAPEGGTPPKSKKSAPVRHPATAHPGRAAQKKGQSSIKTSAKKKTRKKPRSSARFPAGADSSVASRAADLTAAACFSELNARSIAFSRESDSPGVLIPVRLQGPLGGVTYRTDYTDARTRSHSPFEVFDCRLVIALSEFSAILRDHHIDEVRIFSAWRPPSKSWPEGKVGDRHPGALAVDLRSFVKSGGAELDVLRDFHGRIGGAPCGASAAPPVPDGPASRELREILCSAANKRLFHVILSPNHDTAHKNHFHVEVRPNVRWFILE